MIFFYPGEDIKNFSLNDCKFTKLTDFLKGLSEIDTSKLTFEEITYDTEIERFEKFVNEQEESSTGILIEDESLEVMEFKKKYLKYKQKYLQLKNKK